MNSVTRRTLFAAAGVAVVATSSSSCSKASVASSPLVKNFLVEVASAIGAEIVLSVAEKFEGILSDWASGIHSKWVEWKNNGEVANCRAHKVVVDNVDNPTLVVVNLHPVYIVDNACGGRYSDPMYPLNECCAVFFDTAKDAILLPGWAWQTLLMFVEQQKTDKEGAILKQTEQLLRVSLRPTSSRTEEHQTWANAVSTVSWQTGVGPVDIGRIEKEDHTYKGVIKVTGFPDKSGSPIVFEKDIPASLPETPGGWW